MHGPRDPPIPYPSRTAPPCDTAAHAREHKRAIPVDDFQDLLKYPGYYAELYPDILPLTRHLHRQALEQIDRGAPCAEMKRNEGPENVLPQALTKTPDGWYTVAHSEPPGQTADAGRTVDRHPPYLSEQLDVQTVRLSPSMSRASSSSSGGEELRRMEDGQAQNSGCAHSKPVFGLAIEVGIAAQPFCTQTTSAVLDEVERGEGYWGL
ncbi:hypothetical protein C8Q80DRAFT_1267648 [Daedaleopsis nitida]|nr:hypothetical protein C8Q80DRAFT_1267648 [Daedaleopsis nitida]